MTIQAPPVLRQSGVAAYAFALVLLAVALHVAAAMAAWRAANEANAFANSQLVGLIVLPATLCVALAVVRHLLAWTHTGPVYVPGEFRAGEGCLARECWGAAADRARHNRTSGALFGFMRWLTSLAAFGWHTLDALGSTVAELAFGATVVLVIGGGLYGCAQVGSSIAEQTSSHVLGCAAFVAAALMVYALSSLLIAGLALCMPSAEPHLEPPTIRR